MAYSKLGNIRNIILNYTKNSKLKESISCLFAKRSTNNYCLQHNRQKSVFNFRKYKSSENVLRSKDKISEEYELIYRSTIERYLIGLQYCSSLSAVALLGLAFYFDSIRSLSRVEGEKVPIHSENENFVYITLMLCVIVAMQYFLLKVPVRIYKFEKAKEYLFVFCGSLPTTSRHLSCKLGEVSQVSASEALIPWNDSRFNVKDTAGIILFEGCFKTTSELNVMLGLQKPSEDDE